MGDPVACYCKVVMGYEYELDSGYCILPNKEKVIAWEFFRGKVAYEYSYCARKKYILIIDTISTETGFKTPCPFCVDIN